MVFNLNKTNLDKLVRRLKSRHTNLFMYGILPNEPRHTSKHVKIEKMSRLIPGVQASISGHVAILICQSKQHKYLRQIKSSSFDRNLIHNYKQLTATWLGITNLQATKLVYPKHPLFTFDAEPTDEGYITKEEVVNTLIYLRKHGVVSYSRANPLKKRQGEKHTKISELQMKDLFHSKQLVSYFGEFFYPGEINKTGIKTCERVNSHYLCVFQNIKVVRELSFATGSLVSLVQSTSEVDWFVSYIVEILLGEKAYSPIKLKASPHEPGKLVITYYRKPYPERKFLVKHVLEFNFSLHSIALKMLNKIKISISNVYFPPLNMFGGKDPCTCPSTTTKTRY